MSNLEAKVAKDEAEIQQYGFSISELVKKHSIFVDISTQNHVESLLVNLKAQNVDIDVKSLQSQILSNFKDALKGEVDKKFEAFLEQYLAIPDNVPLFNAAQNSASGGEDERELEDLKAVFEEQKTIYLRNKYLIKSLEAELEVYKNLEPIAKKEQELSQMINDYKPSSTPDLDNLVEQVLKL